MEPIKKESMSLTERTQSVSSIPKIPMDFNEFKSRYNELLDYHLNQNIYHDELTFVKEWFTSYSNIIDILQKRTKPELLTPEEQRGLDALRTKNNYYDLKLSFNLIFDFLKQRKREIKAELTTITPVVPAPEIKQKPNKSSLLNGKELNLSERFKIANEVLGIDKKIRILNIKDLEKYQLLAYILGCDKDNARNLMNGSYKSKDRDLLTYFNELGLNK